MGPEQIDIDIRTGGLSPWVPRGGIAAGVLVLLAAVLVYGGGGATSATAVAGDHAGAHQAGSFDEGRGGQPGEHDPDSHGGGLAPSAPLSGGEREYALARARETQGEPGQPDIGRDYELLSVELVDPDPDDPRRVAEVVSYDDDEDLTFFQYVDLGTGAVQTEVASGIWGISDPF